MSAGKLVTLVVQHTAACSDASFTHRLHFITAAQKNFISSCHNLCFFPLKKSYDEWSDSWTRLLTIWSTFSVQPIHFQHMHTLQFSGIKIMRWGDLSKMMKLEENSCCAYRDPGRFSYFTLIRISFFSPERRRSRLSFGYLWKLRGWKGGKGIFDMTKKKKKQDRLNVLRGKLTN